MIGNMDAEILASGWRRRRRRLKDLCAALSCNRQTCARVQTDGEIDVVTGYEAAAVGEEKEQRDGFWWGWRPWKNAI